MRQLLLTLLLLGATLAARAQPAAPYAQLAKLVETPGALFVQDSLWMDETEVANIHYLEYLRFLRQDSTEAQYQTAKPDTPVWSQLAGNDPYLPYCFRYPGFRYYPVVGISLTQAARYCRWRSAMVNQRLHSAEYLKKHPKLRKYTFRVEYRLPTVAEWELAAAGGLDPAQYPYGIVVPPAPGSKQYRQQLVPLSPQAAQAVADCLPAGGSQEAIFYTPFNVLEPYYQGAISRFFQCPALDSLAGDIARSTKRTSYIYANPPNARGLFNMLGNVAELTRPAGVVKGGSFKSSATKVLASSLYTGPQAWLGFRCACTVHIEPLL